MPLPSSLNVARWRAAFTAFLRRRFDRDSELGLRLTINAVLFVVGIIVLGNLIEDVLEQAALVRWDLAVSHWFLLHSVATLARIFAAITLIGSPGAWVVMVIVAVWLFARGQHVLAVGWVATLIGGGIVQTAIKHWVHRSRPALATLSSFSFPSGHTMDATICYPLLAIILGRVLGLSARARTQLLIASFVIIALVGLSRVYLGVHYPSDVLGGLAAGAAWLAASLTVIDTVERRRTARAKVRQANR